MNDTQGKASGRRTRVGILDHTGSGLGGGQLVVAHMAETLHSSFDVELVTGERGRAPKELEGAFRVDLSGVTHRCLSGLDHSFGVPGPFGVRAQLARGRELTKPYDLFIYSGHSLPPFCFARAGLAYCLFPFESQPILAMKADPNWVGRGSVERAIRTMGYNALWRRHIGRYHRVLGCSAYSARWIEKRWGVKAGVLYPPVYGPDHQTAKRNIIVSVGRFTARKPNKGQLQQIQAFREFSRQCPEGWRLALVGFCSDHREEQDYLRSVQTAAEGLPVQCLVNVDRATSEAAIAEARLFWHTTGLDVNEDVHPEFAEHFGIATVEAMRAGCVPVVLASGGQREIVQHGISGILCGDLRQLVEESVRLATHPSICEPMAAQARERGRAFSLEAFKETLWESVKACLNS